MENGTKVRMKTPRSKSLSSGIIVVQKANKPRSYLVKSKGRLYRTNPMKPFRMNRKSLWKKVV